MSEGPLTGKRALVTGVDAGTIGQGIALELARQGAAVVCHYPYADAGAAEAVRRIEAAGGRAGMVQGDFTGGVEVYRRVVDEAAAILGGLNVLVNNAGLTIGRPFSEITPDDFETSFAINTASHFFCSQQAVAWMEQAGGGSIVNITSVHAMSGMANFSAYAATKGAVTALTRQLAVELGPKGIRVNAIGPGAIVVPRYNDIPNYAPESYAAAIPAGRLGEPADIAHAVAFLASDAAGFVTGQAIYVDGGTSAYMSFAAHLAGQNSGG